MTFPFKKILCPVDFYDNSLAALDSAVEMARMNDATICLLHVVPLVVSPTGMPVYVDVYAGQEEAALAKLREIAKAHLAGVTYELHTCVGEPALAILNAQKSIAADAIVIGTHGRRGFSHFLLGSVAERVVREAPCPVMTVRGRATAHEVTADD